jgi:hypothetical protein
MAANTITFFALIGLSTTHGWHEVEDVRAIDLSFSAIEKLTIRPEKLGQ